MVVEEVRVLLGKKLKRGRDLSGISDKQIEDFIRDRFGGGSRRRGAIMGDQLNLKLLILKNQKY